MDYFNDYDNSHPTFFDIKDFDSYTLESMILDTEELDGSQTDHTLENENYWETVDPSSDAWDLLNITEGSASHLAQTNGDAQSPYSSGQESHIDSRYTGHDQLEVEDQSGPIGLANWDGSLTATTLEAPTVVQTPSSVPLGWWGDNKSESITRAFDHLHDAPTSNQPSTGPARTGLGQTRRFQPYGTRTRAVEHVNAEAGPSTSRVPPVSPRTPQPSGGISETTADAECNKTTTEESRASKTKRAKVPRGEGKLRKHRVQRGGDAPILCEWAQKRAGLLEPSTFIPALTAAAEFIPTIRQVANQQPCLRRRATKETEPDTVDAERERGRRGVERDLYRELSRYYKRDDGTWTQSELLSEVVRDLKAHSAQQRGPDESAPGESSSTPEGSSPQ